MPMPAAIAGSIPNLARKILAAAAQNSMSKSGFSQLPSGRRTSGPQIALKMETGTSERARWVNGESTRPEKMQILIILTENVANTMSEINRIIVMTLALQCAILIAAYVPRLEPL